MNKRIKILFLFFIILLSYGCSGNKNPVIRFDGEKYLFGKVKEGRRVVFTFFFFNEGNTDLVIKELNVSCECVIVKEYDERVKPGQRGQIYGFMETKGFQGEVVKAIKVKTNVPDREAVILTLEGNILPGPQ